MKILKRILLSIVIAVGMLFVFIYTYEHYKTSHLNLNDIDFRTEEVITPIYTRIWEYTSDGKIDNEIDIIDAKATQRIKEYLVELPLRYLGEKIDETTSEKPIGYISWLYHSPIPDEYIQRITVTFYCYDQSDNEKRLTSIEIYDNKYIVDYNCRAYEIKNRAVDISQDLKNLIKYMEKDTHECQGDGSVDNTLEG